MNQMEETNANLIADIQKMGQIQKLEQSHKAEAEKVRAYEVYLLSSKNIWNVLIYFSFASIVLSVLDEIIDRKTTDRAINM